MELLLHEDERTIAYRQISRQSLLNEMIGRITIDGQSRMISDRQNLRSRLGDQRTVPRFSVTRRNSFAGPTCFSQRAFELLSLDLNLDFIKMAFSGS
jgi:hypothetical protein